MAQACDVTEHLAGIGGPSAIIGDLNALHGGDRFSRVLAGHTAAAATNRLPHPRLKSIAERVHQMAWGSTFRLLEARGFRDADPAHSASFPSRLPLLHLDRCFVSPEVGARDFAVRPHNPSSDHRAIEVTLEV